MTKMVKFQNCSVSGNTISGNGFDDISLPKPTSIGQVVVVCDKAYRAVSIDPPKWEAASNETPISNETQGVYDSTKRSAMDIYNPENYKQIVLFMINDKNLSFIGQFIGEYSPNQFLSYKLYRLKPTHHDYYLSGILYILTPTETKTFTFNGSLFGDLCKDPDIDSCVLKKLFRQVEDETGCYPFPQNAYYKRRNRDLDLQF